MLRGNEGSAPIHNSTSNNRHIVDLTREMRNLYDENFKTKERDPEKNYMMEKPPMLKD